MTKEQFLYVLFYCATIAASVGFGYLYGRTEDPQDVALATAVRTCQQARAEHRLVGNFERCVGWNVIHQEDGP